MQNGVRLFLWKKYAEHCAEHEMVLHSMHLLFLDFFLLKNSFEERNESRSIEWFTLVER